MDTDLQQMSRDQLIAEVIKLRQGIRAHRDATGHDLCWHHPALWALLPEKVEPGIAVPAWPQTRPARTSLSRADWTAGAAQASFAGRS